MPDTDAKFQIHAPVHKNTRNHQCKGCYFILYLDWFALTMGTFYLFGGFFFLNGPKQFWSKLSNAMTT